MRFFSRLKKRNKNEIDDLLIPEPNEIFLNFLETAHEYLITQQDFCQVNYGLNNYERWHYDQETGLLEFSDSGVVKLRIKYAEIGSISKMTNTWLWAWANPNLTDKVKHDSKQILSFGKTKGYERLTKKKWYGDEYDGWEMTSISAFILKAKGAYSIPTERTISFVVFLEIEDLRAIENTITVNKVEFDLIDEITNSQTDLFNYQKINDNKYIITFFDIDKALELDELIKDKLVFQGFDINYKPNKFGLICEDLVDKMYELIK